MGAYAKGAEMITFLAPPFMWVQAFSMVVKMPVDSMTNSSNINLFDKGTISLLEEGDGFPANDNISTLSLNFDIKFALGRVILEYSENKVEVNEGVVYGKKSSFCQTQRRQPR